MQFQYRAKSNTGKITDGVVAAASQAEAVRLLQKQSLFPLFVQPRGVATPRFSFLDLAYFRKMQTYTKPAEVALFTRQMASMVGAGLSVTRSLRSCARDTGTKKFSQMLEEVAQQVEQGKSLSTSMGDYPGTFDRIYTGLLQTAEASGNLDSTLAQLAEYLERTEALRLKVKAALRYPYFVLGVMAAVLTLMMVKIIPMFAKIYDGFGFPLPKPTQVLVNVSNAVVHNLPVFIGGVVVLIVVINVAGSTPKGHLILDSLKLRMPILGRLLRLYTVSRFARTLGILVSSGTHILYSLDIARAVAGSLLFEQAIEQVRHDVQEGSTMSNAMANAGVFPQTMVQMVATGEETGRLDEMLHRTSVFYEQQVTAAVDGLSSLIEPVIIVGLGSMVGLMIIALYYPIFMMGAAIKGGTGGG
jgi:type IV pilus assembly protein PilC